MRNKKFSITTPLLAATTVLIVIANIILGLILTAQSRSSMRSLISARMLDISNTAAGMIDGDKLEKLTKEDQGSPEYNEQLAILRSFQDNIDLEYIYGIHNDGNDRFSFTIDPARDDPGEFGEQVESTPALREAFMGVASVDEDSYSDRWGTFYSAYSPVFDSSGNIAGVIGVDFSAEWFDKRVSDQVFVVVIVCVVSTLIGVLMALVLSTRIRSRFNVLYDEMNSLAGDFRDLGRLIENDRNAKSPEPPAVTGEKSKDEITELAGQIHFMQTELRQYLTFVQSQAYTDGMTGVGSKTAYLNKVSQLNSEIESGKAGFAVAVFDLNGLKGINDNYGHEAGDDFICCAASAISSAFGTENVYRIGGDEFIAVREGCNEADMQRLFEHFDEAAAELDRAGEHPFKVSVSKGAAVFSSGADVSYNNVFKRADEAMYRCKCEYYNGAENYRRKQ